MRVRFLCKQVIHWEVSSCAIKEELKIESSQAVRRSNSKYTLHFGEVLLGDKQVVSLPLKNVSDKSVHLQMSPLNPLGPFR